MTIMKHLTLLPVLLTAALSAQTIGQFRIVDFAARNPVNIASTSGATITTLSPHGLTTGAAVFIYRANCTVADDRGIGGCSLNNAGNGNRGRGYFIIAVVDATHFTIASEMYTGRSLNDRGAYSSAMTYDYLDLVTFNGASYLANRSDLVNLNRGATNTTYFTPLAVTDTIIPLTTYYLRQGPKVMLDGPIGKGTWSAATAYRTHELVTSGGNSYMAIADNTNQAPPNATYWSAVDPAMIGPGTFSASLRDIAGKANPSPPGGWSPYTALINIVNHNFPQPSFTYDEFVGPTSTHSGSFQVPYAYRWFMDGDPGSYTAALRLATQTEDLAGGSVACDEAASTGFCGRGTGLDYNRLDMWNVVLGLSTIYDTLSSAQKAGLAARLLNGRDVLHNGWEAPGEECTIMSYISGPGSITWNSTTATITGSGFDALTDLQPGSIIFYNYNATTKLPLSRVISKTDTTLTMAQGYGLQASKTNIAWFYSHPFGYGGEKTCGGIWWNGHHGSTPRRIPGQENLANNDIGNPLANMDDSPVNNRIISALPGYIGAALLLGNDDIRAVRLGEQAINYYMTQTMAQTDKSRWTGFDGHGTQYGPGRVEDGSTVVAWMVKNSLTVTPPGILTGGYIKNLMRTFLYSTWVSNPRYVMPWETAYGINFNGSMTAGLSVSVHSRPVLIAANLYPSDPMTPYVYEFYRTRRSGGMNNSESGGWNSLDTLPTVPFYDPTVPAGSVAATAPFQAASLRGDAEECIAAGLYCRPDTDMSIMLSQTGWTNTDTQVMIQGQAAVPVAIEDNYGTAGNITILQNNGSGSSFLLGGNGAGLSGYGSGQTPQSGLYHGNTLSIYNSTTRDLFTGSGNALYARTERWGGDPLTGVADNSYAYAMINMTPRVRNSATGYSAEGASPQSGYLGSANAIRAQRHVIHFKSGPASPNYVVVYDDMATGTPNQLRAYWHYQVSNLANPPVRDTDKVAFDAVNKAATITVPGTGRLTTKILPVGPSTSVALSRDDYTPTQTLTVTNASWIGGTATLTTGAHFGNVAFPVGSQITVTGIVANLIGDGYNGTFTVTGGTSTTVQYALPFDRVREPAAL